jgi:hypothetical protein
MLAAGLGGGGQAHPPALMKSLYLGGPPHLVFKWRFDHLAEAVAGRGRA